jgi:hypothetical protein
VIAPVPVEPTSEVVVDAGGAGGVANGGMLEPNTVPTENAPAVPASGGAEGGQVVEQGTSPTIEPLNPAVPVVPTTDPAVALPINPTVDPVSLPTADTSQIIVSPVPSQVSGIVTFDGGTDYSGITIILTLPDRSTVQTMTDALGAFLLPNLIPGSYRLDAGAAGYLSRWTEFTLAEGQTLSLPLTTLIVGDTNRDNIIDLSDAALIASNFDTPATVLEADLNRDGWIDVKDLAMIGSDYGRTGPLPWQAAIP